MKKIWLLFLVVFCANNLAFAQVEFGIRAGLSTLDVSPNAIFINDETNNQSLGLSLAEAKYSFHAGIFTNIGLGEYFFLQPEVLLNTSKVEYQLDDLSFNEVTSGFFSESYLDLDVPLLLGMRVGPLRLNGGPVGHIHLNYQSDMTDMHGYDPNFEDLTLGWQAGLGLDIGRFRIDARYEGNFTNYGDHIRFGNTSVDFDDTPSRLIASIGFAF